MKEKNNPLITVIMPAYNAQNYIAKAMDSVMKQTTNAFIELIVIDDGSTDNTEKIVEQYRADCSGSGASDRELRYLRNKGNQGVAKSRNLGISEAQGEYIAFLDSDDWWELDKLEKQIRILRQNPDTVLCATGRELMNQDGTSRGKIVGVPEKISYKDLLRTNYIPCSSVVMKTQTAREFGMCHDELHEDYILWLRVTKKYGDAFGLNEPLLKSRMSRGGKSRNKLKSAKMHYGTYRLIGIPRMKALLLMVSYIYHGLTKYM